MFVMYRSDVICHCKLLLLSELLDIDNTRIASKIGLLAQSVGDLEKLDRRTVRVSRYHRLLLCFLAAGNFAELLISDEPEMPSTASALRFPEPVFVLGRGMTSSSSMKRGPSPFTWSSSSSSELKASSLRATMPVFFSLILLCSRGGCTMTSLGSTTTISPSSKSSSSKFLSV